VDFEQFYELDEALHDVICDAPDWWAYAKSPRTSGVRLTVSGVSLHDETRMMETLVEHEAIITAIAEKDPDRAAKTMDAHILQNGANFSCICAKNDQSCLEAKPA
jgi:GntR family transcriptional regulator, rspAB operon transcriptional repressor